MVFILSCDKAEETMEKEIKISFFDEVVLWSPSHVELREDTASYVIVKGAPELLEQMEVVVEDSVLHVTDGRGVKWDTPKGNKISLIIAAPPLKKVETKQSCIIESRDSISSPEFGLVLGAKTNEANIKMKGDVFYYWSGAVTGGKLTVSGRCDVVKLWNAGLLSVDAKNLRANAAIVDNQSRGIVEVQALDQIEYSVRGLGDLHLYGNPPIVNQVVSDESTGTLLQY